jgi:tetratricopeptide (TPR) repeat protein
VCTIDRSFVEEWSSPSGPVRIGRRRVCARPPYGTLIIFRLTAVRKTQVALEYICKRVDSDHHVFWVNGGSWATFSRDYRNISTRLGLLVTDSKEDEIFLRLKNWLESEDSGDWVLVMDNADNPSEFRNSRYIPRKYKGKVIVTTRSCAVAADQLFCEAVEVLKMDASEAETLFQRLCTDTIATRDTHFIRDLLLALDYLPLAIAGAAAFMRTTKTLPSEYLEIFNSTRMNQARLLMKKFNDVHREPQQDRVGGAEEEEGMTESVLTTYYITFRRIQKLCPLSTDILRLFAYLDRQAVPGEFLLQLDGATDVILFREAVGYFLDFSLISRDIDSDSYNVHRLVHLSMETYISQSPDEAANSKKTALRIVSQLFPIAEYENGNICSAYLPHALAVIRYSDDSESEVASLLEKVGVCLYQTGDYRGAREHLERSLEICERTGSDTLGVTGFLAEVYDSQGNYSKALEWYDQALARQERSLGRDHPDTLTTVNNMALVYGNQGDYTKALEWYDRALAGQERSLGRDHPSTLTTVNNMALVYKNQGDYTKALELYDWALAGQERSLGRDNPSTLTTVNNMASVYVNQGDYTKALGWYGRALAGQERSLGRDHPSTLTTVNNMALVYDSQGDYSKALEWYDRVLAGRESSLGSDHPDTLVTVDNMASVYDSQGDYIKALEWYGRALAGKERSLGRHHPSTLPTINNMALVYGNQGDYTKALELYDWALAGQERSLGRAHPSTLTTVNNIALVYKNQGDYTKALEWYDRALAGQERSLGRDHPSTLTTVSNMTSVYVNQGDYTKALEWYDRALAGMERSLGRDHPSTLTIVNNMALVYKNQGDYSKALEWYDRALAGRERSLGRDHPSTLTTVNNMASVYDSQGDYSKALEWYDRQERSLGRDHPDTLATVNDIASAYDSQGDYNKAPESFLRVLARRKELLGKDHPSTVSAANSIAKCKAKTGKPRFYFPGKHCSIAAGIVRVLFRGFNLSHILVHLLLKTGLQLTVETRDVLGLSS